MSLITVTIVIRANLSCPPDQCNVVASDNAQYGNETNKLTIPAAAIVTNAGSIIPKALPTAGGTPAGIFNSIFPVFTI